MKTTILLAEDEPALRVLLTETLSDEGYEVAPAASGNEAMRLVREETFDCILLDQLMPGMTGIEVCEWIRNGGTNNRKVPVILFTPKSLDRDKERALAAGITSWILKPFQPSDLSELVRQSLLQNQK